MLADFVTKCTILEEELVVDNLAEKDPKNQWMMHADSSFNANGLGEGLILTSPEGDIIQYALHFGFTSTKNKVKYEALITGLRISEELGMQHLKAYSDL